MSSSRDQKPDLRTCLLCGHAENDLYQYGPKHSSVYEGSEIVVHYLCLLFSCGLSRSSDNDAAGIQGFAEKDIVKEARRGKKLKCAFCKKAGATLGCCVGSKCKTAYHMPCARRNKVQLVVEGKFESFCRTHWKLKPVVISDRIEDAAICASCTDPVDLTDADSPDVIQCRCCKHICHTLCVQKFAYIGGMHHFKCSFCNCNSDLPDSGLTEAQARPAGKCKKRYVRAAQSRGVFIPHKDADWEMDSSFDGHDQEYGKCDIEDKDGRPACKCDRGTEYDEPAHKRNPWYIVLCSLCAAHGCHRRCRDIAAVDSSDWKCDFCTDIVTKSSTDSKENIPTATCSRSHNSPPESVRRGDSAAKNNDKVHKADRERLNPLPRNSGDSPSRPVTSGAAPAPQPSSSCSSAGAQKRMTSHSSVASIRNDRIRDFGSPSCTSTPKRPKVEVITLSDSESD